MNHESTSAPDARLYKKIRQIKLRGLHKVDWLFVFSCAAHHPHAGADTDSPWTTGKPRGAVRLKAAEEHETALQDASNAAQKMRQMRSRSMGVLAAADMGMRSHRNTCRDQCVGILIGC
jgi:hypothetical protein